MTHWTDDPIKDHSTEVPAHHLHRMAAQFPEPRSMRPDPGGWSNLLREIALGIWAEAYVAGTRRGLLLAEMKPQRMLIVTKEQQDALLAEIDKREE